MGGRGSFSGRGISGSKGGVTLSKGDKIEFSGTLKYYGNDENISGAARKKLEAFEGKRISAKNEYGMVFDSDGTPLTKEVRGKKGSVLIPFGPRDLHGAITTHTHPRGKGALGGTFSFGDMRNFANFNEKTSRARAKEGTYSISKTKNFDKKGFLSYTREANDKVRKNIDTAYKNITKSVRSGKISSSEGQRQYLKAANTEFIKLHEAYKKGEKKYGYKYTLEKN